MADGTGCRHHSRTEEVRDEHGGHIPHLGFGEGSQVLLPICDAEWRLDGRLDHVSVGAGVMKHIDTIYKAELWVEFTATELNQLNVCSCGHYDAICRSLSLRKGLIAEMCRIFKIMAPAEVPSFSLSWRDLDLLCKVLEGGSERYGYSRDLYDALHALLSSTPAMKRRSES